MAQGSISGSACHHQESISTVETKKKLSQISQISSEIKSGGFSHRFVISKGTKEVVKL